MFRIVPDPYYAKFFHSWNKWLTAQRIHSGGAVLYMNCCHYAVTMHWNISVELENPFVIKIEITAAVVGVHFN